MATEQLRVPLPGGELQEEGEREKRNKTTLCIPERHAHPASVRSVNFGNVEILNDVPSLAKTVQQYGQFHPRYDTEDGGEGVENNPELQQIIPYISILTQDPSGKLNVLMYQRASQESVGTEVDAAVLGEPRLRGSLSIGFGGHIAEDDSAHTPLPRGAMTSGKHNALTALDRGCIAELFEETGMRYSDVRSIELIAGFRQLYSEAVLRDPSKIPVGAVHTGIAGMVQLNPASLQRRGLSLPTREVAACEWVPIEILERRLNELKEQGFVVEDWTQIVAKDLLVPYITGESHRVIDGLHSLLWAGWETSYPRMRNPTTA